LTFKTGNLQAWKLKKDFMNHSPHTPHRKVVFLLEKAQIVLLFKIIFFETSRGYLKPDFNLFI